MSQGRVARRDIFRAGDKRTMADLNKSLDDDLPELGGDASAEGYDPGLDDEPAFGAVSEPPLPVSPEPPLPVGAPGAPERVRFAVPAILSFDGYEETFEISVLNLAELGVACTGPQGLAVQDRLRLQFRLSLGADPYAFLCEVVWVQDATQDDATYGLRFIELAD